MLESILIENYKGFKKYRINFMEQNVLVGKNNAGKSTIGEVIRIVSLATSTYKNANYVNRPDWLSGEPIIEKGYSPSLLRTKINLSRCTYRYEEKVAIITAKFKGRSSIKIYISFDGEIFIKIFKNDKCLTSRNSVLTANIPLVKSLPSLKPLLIDEKVYDSSYIFLPRNEKNLSIHFRNVLYYSRNTDKFAAFKESIISTWPGIRLDDLYNEEQLLKLILIDEDFAAEISNFGDGLQIWLQILWFIAYNSEETIVFFDEPDVYLHAELQIKLFEYIKQKFKQFVIATHSVEIICKASRESIIEIDKRKHKSELVLGGEEIQNLISKLGSYANIKVQRILACKKLLFVEGKDIEIIKQIAARIYSKPYGLIDIPYEKSGGRSRIFEKISSLSEEDKGLGIKFYFLTDSDYFDETENNQLMSMAKSKHVDLHIWKRKEIENYLCDIDVVYSSICKKIEKSDLERIIFSITDEMYEDYIGKKVDHITNNNKKLQHSTARKEVLTTIGDKWQNINYRLEVLEGKEILSKLFEILKNDYNISLSKEYIIKNMNISYLNAEVKNYITKIYNGKDVEY